MSEKQFRLFFKRAERKKGITGENLLAMLERRLDNVVYMVGFAHSRTQARQLITHGHFRINDHKVNIPSLLVEKEDLLSLQEKAAEHEELDAIVEAYKNKAVPSWLEVDSENQKVRVVSYPKREDVPLPIEEHLIVELYSK